MAAECRQRAIPISGLAVWLVAAAAPVAGGPAAEHRVELVDGPAVLGKVVAIDADGAIRVLRTATAMEPLSADDVVCLVRQESPAAPPEPAPIEVIFPNRDRLAARRLQATSETIVLQQELLGPVTIPIRHVLGIVFRRGLSEAAVDQLIETLSADSAATDRVWLANGDRLSGSLEAIDESTCRLEGELGPVPVELKQVQAVVFSGDGRVLERPQTRHAQVRLRDGSRLTVRWLRVASGRAELQTLFGPTLTTAFENVQECAFRHGRQVYLSDLEPVGYVHTPYWSLGWPLAVDRSVAGSPLRLRGRRYAKGLGMHSRSRVAYDLAGAYKRLKSTIGVDDSSGGRGCVVFRVHADGQLRYESPPLRGTSAPETIDLEVTGVRRLELEVDFADDADVADHADWADARLIR